MVCVRCIGPVQILVTPSEKKGAESGAARAAPAVPVPTALVVAHGTPLVGAKSQTYKALEGRDYK